MGHVEYYAGSPAYVRIRETVLSGRKLSLDVRRDGVAVKAGEGPWSPALRTDAAGSGTPDVLEDLVKAVRDAASGDSNDDEIAAYTAALDEALSQLGRPGVWS